MSVAIGEDLIAEGWIVRRGRTVVFCESEARGATSGKVVARAVLTYNVQQVKP
jgi:acyl-coenzyme A thioesterase PaaI-like protein